jgi:hypothetical protein
MILVRYMRKHGDIIWGTTELADGTPQVFLKATKGCPYACVIAIDRNTIGWSMCKKGDIFSKKDAVHYAMREALRIRAGYGRPIPASIRNEFDRMVIRAQRYFKET